MLKGSAWLVNAVFVRKLIVGKLYGRHLASTLDHGVDPIPVG